MLKNKILFQLTGSIACFKACQLISKLTQNGFEVQAVASQNALKFIGAATLEGLTGKKVYSDLWESGRMMDHIHLVRWADLIITAPATASYLNKVSNGIGDDLLTTLFLAHDFKKPFLIAPSMNHSMYLHPTVQSSIKNLQSIGLQILPTEEGHLACGETGEGRMLSVEEIYNRITSQLNSKSEKRVLITSGGTSEHIDNVRRLTNISTGQTGSAIADQLSYAGFEVVYLHSTQAQLPRSSCAHYPFETFSDLEKILQSQLKNHFDYIIHCAAVSDYSVEKYNGKLSSEQEIQTLQLRKNKKLINEIRNWSSNKKIKLIAFKMTSSNDPEIIKTAVQKIFSSSLADYVIQNDTSEMTENTHRFHVFSKDKKISTAENKKQLAHQIEGLVKEIEL